MRFQLSTAEGTVSLSNSDDLSLSNPAMPLLLVGDEFRIEYHADGRNHLVEISESGVRVWIDGMPSISHRFTHEDFRHTIQREQVREEFEGA